MYFRRLSLRRSKAALNRLPFWLLLGLLAVCLALVVTQPALMRHELQQARTDSVQRLGAYKTSLLATIDRHLYLPGVLASDPRIVEALDGLQRPPQGGRSAGSDLLQDLNQKAESDEIFLMDARGVTHFSSNYDSQTSFVGKNYGFRPYFRDAMAGKPGFYFAVGATSGVPGLFLSAPVQSEAGATLGVIVIKIDLGKLEQSWAASGDSVWVTDENGIVFLASDSRWHYFSLRPISEALRSELSDTRQYGQDPVTLLTRVSQWQSDGWSTFELDEMGPQVVFGSAIASYPWTMHLRVPLKEIRTKAGVKQAMVVLLYAAFAAASLFYRERRRRTQAQDALALLTAERESHQRAIIQNTDVGLINLDESFRPIFLNEQARSLFKLDVSDADCDPADLIEPWNHSAIGVGPCKAEGIRLDGTRFPVIYTLNPIRVGKTDEYILTVQDVTELTAAQEALEKINRALEHRVRERTRDLEEAQAALAQNQKLAALGRMSAAIAHEINQPITALSNFVASSQVLIERDKPELVSANLIKIESLVQRLSKLSRQLRIFSGKRNSGSSFVLLKAPIEYALELLAPRLEKESVVCDLNISGNYEVRANAMVLEQIVVNLLSNAIDAVAGGPDARITVQVRRCVENPDRVVMTIEDNGHGMTDDQLGQIFEPFFTTKPMGEGLGLGLAISYSLACDIGAELTASSQTGEGTCFTLNLPMANTITTEAGL
ncbi:His Kinase A (phospho-acceptor) domain-containing protein [Marinobacter gudaonensis]|uniref:histidine kinase n=1 Tax=Marinobacter gudaonensis TaxID=375760 RepID=A0A1I6HP36_9GAMM|nr:ATP-binding protein [Marinobacter gudaonensis]SFR56144.1 His Kinase A (phospho-acceptor) domain-containing protein [Marinobacter gudaonensis]